MIIFNSHDEISKQEIIPNTGNCLDENIEINKNIGERGIDLNEANINENDNEKSKMIFKENNVTTTDNLMDN